MGPPKYLIWLGIEKDFDKNIFVITKNKNKKRTNTTKQRIKNFLLSYYTSSRQLSKFLSI